MAMLDAWRKSIVDSVQTTSVTYGQEQITREIVIEEATKAVQAAAGVSIPDLTPAGTIPAAQLPIILSEVDPQGAPIHYGDVWINVLTRNIWEAAGILLITDWRKLTKDDPATAEIILFINESSGQLFMMACRNNVDGDEETYLKPLTYFAIGTTYYELRSRVMGGVNEPYLVDDVTPLAAPVTIYMFNESNSLGYELKVRLNEDRDAEWYLSDVGVAGVTMATRLKLLTADGSDTHQYGCRTNLGQVELYAID